MSNNPSELDLDQRRQLLDEARAMTHRAGLRTSTEARRAQDAWAEGKLELDQLFELLAKDGGLRLSAPAPDREPIFV